MKRIFAISTTAALLLTGLTSAPAHAATVNCSSGGTFTITGTVVDFGSTCSGNAEIPASITEIADYAFEYSAITGITFVATSSLARIGESALSSTALNSIVIPASVTEIADFAFSLTSSLTTVSFASGSTLASIGDRAFYLSALTAIAIPAAVSTIDTRAFSSTGSLATLTFDAGSQLTVLTQDVFRDSGITSVEIPSGVTNIGPRAFYGNTSLTTLRIPATVTAIGASAFEAAGSLTDVYFAGTSAPTVGADAFGDGGTPRATSAKANISFSARASFGLLGTTWQGLSVQYDEPAPAPAAIAIPAPTTSPAIDERAAMTFAFKGSALTKKQRKNLRSMVSEVGRKGSFEITVGVVKKKGMSRAAAKVLARKQAKLFRDYLASRGIKPKQIVVKTEMLAAGETPFIGVAGS